MSKEKLKYLEFIQNIITCMQSNSFQIKKWTVYLISAILLIYILTSNEYFILLAVFPTFIFSLLDTYYLTQERVFCELYNNVTEVSENTKKNKLFEMRSDFYISSYSYFKTFISATVLLFYVTIITFLVILFMSVYIYI